MGRTHRGTGRHTKAIAIRYFECAYCNKLSVIQDWACYKNRRFCSGACNRKGGFRYQGESHWNHNPERPVLLKLRNSLEMKVWSRSVLEKYDFVCQLCGRRGVDLHAHHILPFSDFPEQRFDVENGVPLCVKCHRETYRFHGNQYVDAEIKVPIEKWREFRENLRSLGYGNPEPSLSRKRLEGAETTKEPYRRVTIICVVCGEEKSRPPSQALPTWKTCSYKCKATLQSRNFKRDSYGRFRKSAPPERDEIVRAVSKDAEVSLNG